MAVPFLVAASALAVSGASAQDRRAERLPLAKVVDIRLPGGNSRFDYLSVDAGRNRLFLAHLGADQVTVVDTERRAVVGSIDGIPSVHGVLVVPELQRVFASAFDADELVTIDEAAGTVLARSKTGRRPDNIAYDPRTHRIFVADFLGGTVTVADARTGRRIGAVRVGGLVGNVQYDGGSGRMLVNAQSRGELVSIDARTLRLVGRTRLSGCRENHGLVVDAGRRLAFVGCQLGSRLAVVDLGQKRIVACPSVGNKPDLLAFDGRLRRLYVASEAGVLSVFSVRDRVRRIGQAFVAPNAHSVAVDPRSGLLYLPLENAAGPVLRVMAPRASSAARAVRPGCPAVAPPSPASSAQRNERGTPISVVMRDGEIALSRGTVQSGLVVFEVVNRGVGAHAFAFPGLGRQSRALDRGQRAVLRIVFPHPGRFQYLCAVGKHAELGEAGVLVVR